MSYLEAKREFVEAALGAIQRAKPDIVAVCQEVFDNPEPAFSEERAAQWITELLASSGFQVEGNLAGLPTAFKASYQRFDSEAMRKGLRHGHVTFLAEYDADDERGHSTGRHLAAGAALAAAIGAAAGLREDVYGSVTVIGCPASSTSEGKDKLAEAGVFEPEDAALGARPMSAGAGFQPTISSTGETLAESQLRLRFSGPSGESEARQRYATEAQSVAQPDSETGSVEVVLTDEGVDLHLRAVTNPELEALATRLREIADACAAETGSTAEIDTPAHRPAFNVNRLLARRIKTYADNYGLKQDRIIKTGPAEPSDWGNVSLITATAQARFPISSDAVESGTEAFMQASVSPYAYDQMLAAAGALALTALDLLGDMEFRGFAEGELIRTLKAQGMSRTPRRWLGVHPVKPREDSNGHSPVSTGKTTGNNQS